MWCLELESNQRPPDFQSSTLPTELSKHMVGREGLEPPMYLTSRVYSPLRSPNFATYRQMVLQVGFEPTTPRLEGACSSPLSYWSICGGPDWESNPELLGASEVLSHLTTSP